MKTWHVMREHERAPNDWRNKVTSHVPSATIVLSPVYDENLGYSLGMLHEWISKDDLHKWIQQRLVLSGLPSDYVLIPPVGWYRDPDYNEK